MNDETQRQDDDELAIDTSKMSASKRQAMELAESAREQQPTHPSFGQQLFMGGFDAEMLSDFPEQDDDDRAIGDRFMEQFAALLRKHIDPEEVDATRTIPQAAIDAMAELGVFAMKVPQDYGGLGFSQINYNRVMMMLATYCASTAVLVSAHQSIGVPQPLKLFGTEEQKQRYFPRFREGAISAFALTEPGVGSDPARMATTAEPIDDGARYRINGDKLWCTNGPIADILVVMAQTPPKMVRGRERQQITAFIVERSTPGIEVLHRCDFMGLRGIQNGLLRFTDVEVPAENIIWGEGRGLKLALTTLNTGRLTLPAACTGVAKQCLSIARRWGNAREQWGLAIGKHEHGRDKISRMAATTFAMEAVTLLTSHWADRKDVDIRIEAAMAKLFCSEAGWQIVDDTMQLRGGRGYERASSLAGRGETAFPVERIMRDMRINTIIEGTSEIMRLFLAREAMDPHLRVAADLLSKRAPFGKKLRAGVGMAKFYAAWYPVQWINSSIWDFHDEMGALADHYSYVDGTAHRLARSIFHAMGMYQDRLERKQLLLGRLIDIGTQLFVMATTCSYARHLHKKQPDDQTPIALADLFCRHATRQVEALFDRLHDNDDEVGNRVAKAVLDGQMKWLEDGIMWIASEYDEE